MVRLKKKRFIIIDYSIIPTPADQACAAVTPHESVQRFGRGGPRTCVSMCAAVVPCARVQVHDALHHLREDTRFPGDEAIDLPDGPLRAQVPDARARAQPPHGAPGELRPARARLRKTRSGGRIFRRGVDNDVDRKFTMINCIHR